MDRVCGKIDNLPQSVFRGPSRLRICHRAELPPTKMVGDWPKEFFYVVNSPGEAAPNANDGNLLLGRHGRDSARKSFCVGLVNFQMPGGLSAHNAPFSTLPWIANFNYRRLTYPPNKPWRQCIQQRTGTRLAKLRSLTGREAER
ncbi:hypothetical protein LSAT2_024731 [Lamellibrachia satsuma]|nr:hypothetical protein LSAT2_024731 [Lamellibrachia satsuma]